MSAPTPMPGRESVPAALRAAVQQGFAPVVPLAPPWRRALALALPTLLVLSAAVVLLARQSGVGSLFALAAGGVSVLEWLAGLGLVWLALRALPIRPRWSGALAGAAAGLLADAVCHLACPRNDLEHLLVWHFGATVAMTLLGALAGSFSNRRPKSV